MKSTKSYVKELEDLLGPVDEKITKEVNDHFEKIEQQYKWMEENNIPQDLRKYYFDLEVLKTHDYKPVAVTTMMCENTFVFETEDEAIRAFEQFEKHPSGEYISGWWYSRESFDSSIKEYAKEVGYDPKVIWF
ncbi:hypothetical protein IPJ63_01650 [Candidatus Nomurabacteria bacterium]|nr:MAG: hypothetical protein IPJ63_01650 [Candidatus Nomurabacteria bacterium]